jgi:hypothetical protein
MADTATIGFSVTWTPPLAPVNSGQSTMNVQTVYNGGPTGSIDIPTGTIVGTTFDIPMAALSAAKTVIIKNMMSTEIGIRINGSITNNFNLPPGGMFAVAGATAPLAVPLTAVTIVTTADPTVTERVHYFAFGD